MKEKLILLLKALGLYEIYQVPWHISTNFTRQDPTEASRWSNYIKETMFPDKDLRLPEAQDDFDAHVTGRLEKFRQRHIPFLDHMLGLKGKHILEIGCGTGSSSVALAEQGARVLGLDVDEPSLEVARERINSYKLQQMIALKEGNAMELGKIFKPEEFDVVIFFASIEHMTHPERILALKGAWQVLKKGGALCILGTPNRLWYFDVHTSSLPFYMWLPDDLAHAYSAFSPRERFNQLYKYPYEENKLEFLRWGRGVSYHELEIAIRPVGQLNILGDLHSFERPKTFLQQLAYKRTRDYKFRKMLSEVGPPGLSTSLYEYYLDFIVKKD